MKNLTISKTQYLTRLVFIIAITFSMEFLGLPQPVTGPLVNMFLILATLLLNIQAGIIVGLLTPLIAVFRGQLPPILISMVPFIILGNWLLVFIFGIIQGVKKNTLPSIKSPWSWFSIVCASVTKFLWIWASARLVLPIVFGKELPPKLLAMMAFPQFLTALIGGALALFLYEIFQRFIKY